MQLRAEKSAFHGPVSILCKGNIMDSLLTGTAALEHAGNLVFFDETNLGYEVNFDIDGCLVDSSC
jgi:hypothetical protein